MDDLNEIEARANAASAEPLDFAAQLQDDDGGMWWMLQVRGERTTDTTPPGLLSLAENTARFFAQAREDVRRLVDHIRSMEAK